MRQTRRRTPLGVIIATVLATAALPVLAAGSPPGQVKDPTIELPQLNGPARILRDADGMPHIYAQDEHDAIFLQGWVTAQDRLFQIDVVRRQASGTLAALVGSGALASDVELQTIGLRRAAQRSLDAYSPAMRAGLQAFADGVNAWVARNALPVQYGALQVTKFEPWTALDSAVVGKALAFQLSFDLDIEATQNFQAYEAKLGSLGAQAMFFGDVFRSAPFDPAASVPDATGEAPFLGALKAAAASRSSRPAAAATPSAQSIKLDGTAQQAIRSLKQRYDRVPFLRTTLTRTEEQIGSNEWAVAGWRTTDGRPLVANDPHLGLDLPPNFHQIHLVARKQGLDSIGSAVAGAPYVVLGQNRHVTWGETTTGFDVTDTYLELLQPDASSPSGVSSTYLGQKEPAVRVPLEFRVNLRDGLANGPDSILTLQPGQFGVPGSVLTIPRRNHGPVIADLGGGLALSVQYTGFGPTRELETFRLLNFARNLQDFTRALQYFDVGSQNFIYGDVAGNIGYFTTSEVPLREDLQANTVNGAPPWFIRSGFGGNEWLKDPAPDALNGTGYLSLPFAELPQTVNPKNGFVVNANNDTSGATLDNNPLNQLRPGGQGIYYLGYTFDFGTRAGRITQALGERFALGRVDREDMKAIQADVKLLDAEVFTPYITGAFDRAQAPGAPAALAALAADPRVAEAVGRLRAWNHTTPTGAATGYDASDVDGQLAPPSADEVAHSVAATIYSVWRSQAIRNGVDTTLTGLGLPTPGSGEAIKALRHLVERDGIGLSTVDFFGWAGAAGLTQAAQRRDYVMLKSLADALGRLASDDYKAAFANSTNQADYVWGKLHRIVFDGLVVEGPFSIPGATPGFPPSFAGLRGLATDGGFGVVDASSHSARADSVNAFMFGGGPNRRYVGSPGGAPGSIEAETALPGGMSGVLGSPFYANLLGRWLTNDTYPLRLTTGEVMQNLHGQQSFRPARPRQN